MTSTAAEPTTYTVSEVAGKARVTPKTVRKLARLNLIPGVLRVGTRSIRFKRSVVDKWLEDGGQPCTTGVGAADTSVCVA